jgi:hypothetical protein
MVCSDQRRRRCRHSPPHAAGSFFLVGRFLVGFLLVGLGLGLGLGAGLGLGFLPHLPAARESLRVCVSTAKPL